MTRVMCLQFKMQEEDILEHANTKCHVCTLYSTCRLLCNVGILFITLLNILLPILVSTLQQRES